MATKILLAALKISILLVMVPLLTGCWDRLEIEERAVILGIGIDVVEEQQGQEEEPGVYSLDGGNTPEKKLIRITAQIAVPGRIPLGPGEGGGSQVNVQPVWAVSATGRTIDGAFMMLQQELADRIFFGHLRVVVISEELARGGIENLNDYFRRNPQIRRLTWLVVSKGPAEAFMKAKPELERVPALYLLAMLDHAVDLGKYPSEQAGRFWSKESSDGQEPNMPYIELKQDDKIMIAGMAMFKGDRMVGVTEPIEVGFYMGITDTEQGGYAAYTTIPGTDQEVMFHATRRRSSTSLSLRNGKPHFHVDIRIEGDIREKTKDVEMRLDEKAIREIERKLTESAMKANLELIAKTQSLGSDIFGFGEHVRAKEYGYWKQHVKSKEGWRALYPEVEVDVQIDIKIRRIGMNEI